MAVTRRLSFHRDGWRITLTLIRPTVNHAASSVQQRIARPVAALVVLLEYLRHLRMPQRLARGIGQEVLLGDISNVFALRVLREQMIERLVLVRAHLGRD